jgi:hypothetical protein
VWLQGVDPARLVFALTGVRCEDQILTQAPSLGRFCWVQDSVTQESPQLTSSACLLQERWAEHLGRRLDSRRESLSRDRDAIDSSLSAQARTTGVQLCSGSVLQAEFLRDFCRADRGADLGEQPVRLAELALADSLVIAEPSELRTLEEMNGSKTFNPIRELRSAASRAASIALRDSSPFARRSTYPSENWASVHQARTPRWRTSVTASSAARRARPGSPLSTCALARIETISGSKSKPVCDS